MTHDGHVVKSFELTTVPPNRPINSNSSWNNWKKYCNVHITFKLSLKIQTCKSTSTKVICRREYILRKTQLLYSLVQNGIVFIHSMCTLIESCNVTALCVLLCNKKQYTKKGILKQKTKSIAHGVPFPEFVWLQISINLIRRLFFRYFVFRTITKSGRRLAAFLISFHTNQTKNATKPHVDRSNKCKREPDFSLSTNCDA